MTFVRIELARSSAEFVAALARLMNAVEHADRALLEDEIADAHAELKAQLQGLAFESGGSEDE